MRQHVNPLSRFFQLQIDLPTPEEIFENIDLPIHLDIGCARGKFLINMASNYKQWNFLGLEIREALVLAAEKERLQLDIKNLRFIFCNASISLEKWFSSLKSSEVQRVSIQFPDPWFKRRHKKRRVLTSSLLLTLAKNLKEGSELFIQTDILNVMDEMTTLIESSNFFSYSTKSDIYLTSNPFQFKTEREDYVIKKGFPVYRKLYFRNRKKIVEVN